MSPRRAVPALVALGLFLSLCGARPSFAQDSPPSAPCSALSTQSPRTIDVAVELGECYRSSGRAASAYVAFEEAAKLATAQGDPRAAVLSERVSLLRTQIVFFSISMPQSAPGVTVLFDGKDLPEGALGRDMPVDPGPHVVMALAPGKQSWSQSVDASRAGQRYKVEIPPLTGMEPPKEPEPPPPPSGKSGLSSGRLFLYSLLTGMTAVACVPASFASLADAEDRWAKARGTEDPDEAKRLRESAEASKVGAFVLVGVSAGFAGLTTVLAWLAFREEPKAPAKKSASVGPLVSFAPLVAPSGGGLLLQGRF